MRRHSGGHEPTASLKFLPAHYLFRILISALLLTFGHRLVLGSKHKTVPSGLPSFRETQSDYSFSEGDLAVLYCSVHNLGARTVSWRKASAPSPLIVGKMVFTADNRFQVAHVPDREEWNLLIKNVNHDDAGLYECQVSSKEKYIRRIVRVIVKDRPYADRAIVINGPHTVKRGESLLLSCNATGGKSAPSDLDWMKDDKKLTADKSGRINITKHISYVTNTIVSNLTIKKVVDSDEGVYVCRTSDEMVKNVSIEVTGEGSENVKRTISQDAPATSCATSSTFVLYMFVFVVHCSLRYSQLVHLVLFFCGYLWRSQEFPIS